MFGDNTANIKAVISAEDKASHVLKGFGDNVGSFGGKLESIAKTGAVAFAGLTTAAVGFGALTLKSFSESQDLIAQTNAVLKSTGGVAGVTADQVTNLANAWEHQTKFSDEAVRNAENIILTFTDIGKNIFPQTTQAVLDISTALHEDMQSAAIQVGKALQDPVLGVTALRRVGVNFSSAQQDVIKNLVETGQKAKAQQLILAELNREFGGSAKAAGSTFSGSLAKLKNNLDDVGETIGGTIANRLQPFISKASNALLSIDWTRVINLTINGLKAFGAEIGRFIEKVVEVAKQIWSLFGPSLEALFHTIQDRLLPSLIQLWNTLNPALMDALKIMAKILGAVVVVAIWAFINVLNVVISVLGGIIRAVSTVIGWFGNFGGAIWNLVRQIPSAFSGVASTIISPFRSAFDAIARLWNSTVGKLHFTVPSWVPGIGGKGWDVPDIPLLAEGGIVTKPTLAMIGEAGPEAVVPLSKGSQKVGGTTNIHITVQAGAFMGTNADARRYAQLIANALKDVAISKNMTLPQLIGVKA